jgi:hypothetical protein
VGSGCDDVDLSDLASGRGANTAPQQALLRQIGSRSAARQEISDRIHQNAHEMATVQEPKHNCDLPKIGCVDRGAAISAARRPDRS